MDASRCTFAGSSSASGVMDALCLNQETSRHAHSTGFIRVKVVLRCSVPTTITTLYKTSMPPERRHSLALHSDLYSLASHNGNNV